MAKSISTTINNWFKKYKKYLLLYRNGFWEIPYLSNSPETIIRSVIKMPITKHIPKRQYVISKTPLIKGSFYYEEIEEGLWLINNKLSYKSNINYVKVGDGEGSNDWYLLNLTVFGIKQKHSLMDGIPYTNCVWILYKPNSWSTNCHFKGAEECAFTFYFSKAWLAKRMDENNVFANSPIRHFFESEHVYDMWNDTTDQLKFFYEKIAHNFEGAEERTQEKKHEQKEHVYTMLEHFFSSYEINNVSIDHFKVSDKVRIKMYKVEKLLLEGLLEPFPGIQKLIKEVGISETSLKVNFKLIFGTSTRQYFQQKQMYLAKDILTKDNIQIQELAKLMGYENASKFSAAFKKHNKILPSKVIA